MVVTNLDSTLNLNFKAGNLNGTSTDNDKYSVLSFKQIFNTSLKSKTNTSTSNTTNNLMVQSEKVNTIANQVSSNESETKINTTKDNNTKKDNVDVVETQDLKEVSVSKDVINEKGEEIIEKIANDLDVTADEIIEIMASLNMTVFDLFDPNFITDLLVELNGQGEVALVVDGDFRDILQDVISFVKDELYELSNELEINPDAIKENFKENKVDFEGIFLKEDAAFKVEDTGLELKMTNLGLEVKEINQNTNEIKEEKDTLKDVIADKMIVETRHEKPDLNKEFGQNKGMQSETKNEDLKTVSTESNTFINNVAQSFTEAIESIPESAINEVDVARQVIEQVKVINTQNLNSIEVMLNPENLGSVHVTVTAKEGIITAQLSATNEAVKKALENQMVTLKENFNNQGIKVAAVEVTVQSHGFENSTGFNKEDNNQAENNKNKQKRVTLDLSSLDDLDYEELTKDEIRAKDLIRNGEASVSYMA